MLLVEPDGNVVPTIIQIYDDELTGADCDEMIGVMRARPGRRAMTADNGLWCRAFHRQLSRAGLDTFAIFQATDESLGPVPPDVLVDVA